MLRPSVAAAVRASGGKIIMEKATIAGVGELIFFQDPDGNVAGAMRYDATEFADGVTEVLAYGTAVKLSRG